MKVHLFLTGPVVGLQKKRNPFFLEYLLLRSNRCDEDLQTGFPVEDWF
jgi:hypothetical protein